LNFVSTSNFRESLYKLTKRADSGYKSCCKDLCDELKDASFDDIYNRHFLIKESGDLRVIKLRIQNSDQNLSSAAGYRLIIICNRKYDHIAFVDVYPKKGKYSKMDLTKVEYRNTVNNYGVELKSDQLVTHDINKELIVIEKKKSSAKKE
jgi:hypothetical protein